MTLLVIAWQSSFYWRLDCWITQLERVLNPNRQIGLFSLQARRLDIRSQGSRELREKDNGRTQQRTGWDICHLDASYEVMDKMPPPGDCVSQFESKVASTHDVWDETLGEDCCQDRIGAVLLVRSGGEPFIPFACLCDPRRNNEIDLGLSALGSL